MAYSTLNDCGNQKSGYEICSYTCRFGKGRKCLNGISKVVLLSRDASLLTLTIMFIVYAHPVDRCDGHIGIPVCLHVALVALPIYSSSISNPLSLNICGRNFCERLHSILVGLFVVDNKKQSVAGIVSHTHLTYWSLVSKKVAHNKIANTEATNDLSCRSHPTPQLPFPTFLHGHRSVTQRNHSTREL